jgi:hypothetical protein
VRRWRGVAIEPSNFARDLWRRLAAPVSGVPGIDGHPGNDNGSAGCRPADDRALAE